MVLTYQIEPGLLKYGSCIVKFLERLSTKLEFKKYPQHIL